MELRLILPSLAESESWAIDVFSGLGEQLLDSLMDKELLSEESDRLAVFSVEVFLLVKAVFIFSYLGFWWEASACKILSSLNFFL